MFKNTPAFSSFSVNDMNAAKEFYSMTLGLALELNQQGVIINLNGGGRVFLYEKQNHRPATFTVLNFEVEDIDKAVDELTAKGVQFEHYNEPVMMKTDEKGIVRGEPQIAWCKDPAGNFIAIIQEKKA